MYLITFQWQNRQTHYSMFLRDGFKTRLGLYPIHPKMVDVKVFRRYSADDYRLLMEY